MGTQKSPAKKVYGYIEKVTFPEFDLTLAAKLDTGAKTASLNAMRLRPFTRHHKQYIAFLVPSKTGDVEFEAEYVGDVKIKMRSGENILTLKTTTPRPVVLLKIKLGETERTIRVNLANRNRF